MSFKSRTSQNAKMDRNCQLISNSALKQECRVTKNRQSSVINNLVHP